MVSYWGRGIDGVREILQFCRTPGYYVSCFSASATEMSLARFLQTYRLNTETHLEVLYQVTNILKQMKDRSFIHMNLG